MKNVSGQAKRMICYVLLVISAMAFFFVNRYTGVRVSDDSLSTEIAARWNAALPAGFEEKETAGQIDENGGMCFARLVYKKDVAKYLKKWTAPDEHFRTEFDALLESLLKNASDADAALIARARPSWQESWICFSLTGSDEPENEILLCYQSATRIMLIAERRVPPAGAQ